VGGARVGIRLGDAAMNFLFLVPKKIYDEKMSRVRFDEVASLIKVDPGHTVRTTGPGWPGWPDGLQPIDYVRQIHKHFEGHQQEQIHLILSYEVEGLQGSPIKVAMIFHETYNWGQTLRKIRDTGATLVIFTYANDLAAYEHELAKDPVEREVAFIPHSADPAIYRDYSVETPFVPGYKHIDVLVVGNLAREFYPFRHRLARLAHREIRKRGYTVVTLPHPGFTLPARPGTVVGDEYATMLNRSKLVLTCTGRHHYAFNKLVEIPLCWSLPVSDLPAERQGFFRQTMLNVEMWHTDREILGKIEDVLDDDEVLKQLTTMAHDKVAQRLTMPYWAERFLYLARRHVWGENPEPPTPPVGEEDM
jgi:hypothetical protein